jgi:hypothetical protein
LRKQIKEKRNRIFEREKNHTLKSLVSLSASSHMFSLASGGGGGVAGSLTRGNPDLGVMGTKSGSDGVVGEGRFREVDSREQGAMYSASS